MSEWRRIVECWRGVNDVVVAIIVFAWPFVISGGDDIVVDDKDDDDVIFDYDDGVRVVVGLSLMMVAYAPHVRRFIAVCPWLVAALVESLTSLIFLLSLLLRLYFCCYRCRFRSCSRPLSSGCVASMVMSGSKTMKGSACGRSNVFFCSSCCCCCNCR